MTQVKIIRTTAECDNVLPKNIYTFLTNSNIQYIMGEVKNLLKNSKI